MNKAFIEFLNKQINSLKQSKNKSVTVQKIARTLDNIMNGTKFDTIYDAVLGSVIAGSMGTWQQVMSKQDFIKNGASKKSKEMMDKSKDSYFIDKSYDGKTPFVIYPNDYLDQLETLRDTAKSGLY